MSSAGRTRTLEVATPVRASFALPATILGGGMLLTGLASLLSLGYGRREQYAAEVGERLLEEREQVQGALEQRRGRRLGHGTPCDDLGKQRVP